MEELVHIHKKNRILAAQFPISYWLMAIKSESARGVLRKLPDWSLKGARPKKISFLQLVLNQLKIYLSRMNVIKGDRIVAYIQAILNFGTFKGHSGIFLCTCSILLKYSKDL